ncbi:zinc ribbon-containing protein [Thiohalobacter sp. IOR34]|uniref:zinc ribbon-containing protein n=1 Tax=Thiohalobacter sp. IOR34 TaxID=3057176 RepID=UPI0025AF94A2|nr:zinc ribbon-containing protein [Thiohalobacter sp. IOR34]WJW76353.1 zinc ribbon-containing protein [Thiohalobacter sp. IOR34]
MKDPLKHDPLDVLGEAYERMLERAMEDFHKAEEKTGPALHQMIDGAREKAVELGELSREEAEKVANYLKRDLAEAASYLDETGRELKDWLGLETRLVESELLDLFMRAADKTTLELIQFKEALREASTYHTGEIAGPGTLVCDACGERLHFQRAGRIPPCPKCHATRFHRERGQ